MKTKTKTAAVKREIKDGGAELEILRNAFLFSMSTHKWGNRASVSRREKNDNVSVESDKDELNITKRLVVCEELEKIRILLDETAAWCVSRSMMSTVRKGVYFVKREMMGAFEAKIKESNKAVVDELLPAFFKVYPKKQEEAKKKLGVLYRESDYPSEADLKRTFYIEWNWFGMNVPDELPDEVRAREVKKLKETFAEAQKEVRNTLRDGLKQLVSHAADRLKVGPGAQAKVLRDKSMVKNFNEFFDTFSARDMTNDVELARVMEDARKIVAQFDADAVRENVDVRNEVAEKFEQVNKQLDALLINKPSRKFNFD